LFNNTPISDVSYAVGYLPTLIKALLRRIMN